MARAEGGVTGNQGLAQQVQVAHGIENFVFHKFIVVAQAIAVQDFVVVHHDGIVKAATQRQAIGAKHFNVFGKTKSARTGNVTRIQISAHVKHHLLAC